MRRCSSPEIALDRAMRHVRAARDARLSYSGTPDRQTAARHLRMAGRYREVALAQLTGRSARHLYAAPPVHRYAPVKWA